MTKNEGRLVKCLREIAEAVFSEDVRLQKYAGICYALYNWTRDNCKFSSNSCRELDYLLESSLNKVEDFGMHICTPGQRWEARAYFCLLLAEVIEKGNFDD